jgi:tripartite-type tricarboxylate transporter receptor subunit TctC
MPAGRFPRRKATPDAVVSRIEYATRTTMSDSSLLDACRSQGMEPDTQSTPDAFQLLVEAERSGLERVIKSIGFKAD